MLPEIGRGVNLLTAQLPMNWQVIDLKWVY